KCFLRCGEPTCFREDENEAKARLDRRGDPPFRNRRRCLGAAKGQRLLRDEQAPGQASAEGRRGLRAVRKGRLGGELETGALQRSGLPPCVAAAGRAVFRSVVGGELEAGALQRSGLPPRVAAAGRALFRSVVGGELEAGALQRSGLPPRVAAAGRAVLRSV